MLVEIFPIEGNTDFNNICFLRRNTQLTEQFDFFSVIRWLITNYLRACMNITSKNEKKNACTLHAAEM